MSRSMEKQMPLAVFASLIAFFFVQTDGFVQQDILAYCTMKSAPIFMLALMTYMEESQFDSKVRLRCALGLAFSGVGDFLLSTNELGFHLGSISFAIGHICYIAYFAPLLRVLSYGVTAACMLYTLFVNHFFIVPYLSHTPAAMLTLIGYSFVICVGVVVAGSLFVNGSLNGQKGQDFRALMAGYGLFFFSDTFVLLVHLGYMFPYSEVLILLSYYAAQYLIFHNAMSALPAMQKVEESRT